MKRVVALLLLIAGTVVAQTTSNPLFEQGKAAMRAAEYEKAEAAFAKLVASNPKNAEYHYWLGAAYGSQAQEASIFSQASLASKTKSEFEQAVALDPNQLEAREGLIDYYTFAPSLMGGSIDKAKEQAAEIRKRDAIKGHLAFARIYLRDKKPELARKEYTDMVREQPTSSKAHYWLGIYYFSNDKNYKAATDEFEGIVRMDPAYLPAYFQIGHVAALAGNNFPRGEETLKRYLGYTPKEDEPPVARAHYWLGVLYEKQGKKAEARQSYVTSLKLNAKQKDVSEALKRVS